MSTSAHQPQTTPLSVQIAELEGVVAMSLPSLPYLRAEVQRLTTGAVLGTPAAMAELKLAVDAVSQAEYQHEQRERDLQTLERLRFERQRELADERAARVKEAAQRLSDAHAEFHSVAKQLCRAYARCLQVSEANGRMGPGFPTALPGHFTLPDMVPYSWTGTTDQHIRDGALRWMNEEYR